MTRKPRKKIVTPLIVDGDMRGVKVLQSHAMSALAGVSTLGVKGGEGTIGFIHKGNPPKRLVNPSGVPGALMRPEYNTGAAARAAYETFIREAGVEKDARVGTWDQLKTFHKARWRTVAQAVIDAATGEQRKVGLTSAPDVRGSTKEKGRPHGGDNEQDIPVRGRQPAKPRRGSRRAKGKR